MQSIIIKWYHEKFSLPENHLGFLVGIASLFSALSSLLVPKLVALYGPVKTMVFTHIPSSVFLILIPFVSKPLAMVFLLARALLSQMDVPARSALITLSVESDRRSAANGIVNLLRTGAVAIPPFFLGAMLNSNVDDLKFQLPFILAGSIKIVYDLMLYWFFGRSNEGTL